MGDGLEKAAPENPQRERERSETPRRRSSLAHLALWGRDLTLSVLLAVVVILFIYQPVKVEGTSMMPSLVDQQRIFINKFIYRFGLGEIRRGDLVVFWFPENSGKSFIKRVVGLPGDLVAIQEGAVIVNGTQLVEEYVPAEYRDTRSSPPVVVPPDHYYVLGDHRSSSNDSRNWGPVSGGQIYGKAVFVYWPLEKAGPIQ